MTPVEQSWLAGVIDGEGWIGIRKRNEIKGYYSSNIGVTNCNIPFLLNIVKITGVNRVYSKKRSNPKWRDVYRWHLDGDRVIDVLKQILPYLIIKKNQASLAIDLQNTNKQYGELKGNKHGGTLLSQREKDFRLNIYNKIRVLNKKGVEC